MSNILSTRGELFILVFTGISIFLGFAGLYKCHHIIIEILGGIFGVSLITCVFVLLLIITIFTAVKVFEGKK